MSKKNIYEVFDDFKSTKNKKDRIKVLQDNDTWALRQVLIGTLHPGAKFVIKEAPLFKRDDSLPPGMGYNNMTQVLDKIYLFMENNPRTPAGLTDKRKNELLIQILESLEPREADVYMGIILKDQKIPYLTEALINEAFPGLLPQS
jgi:hypothetical protein